MFSCVVMNINDPRPRVLISFIPRVPFSSRLPLASIRRNFSLIIVCFPPPIIDRLILATSVCFLTPINLSSTGNSMTSSPLSPLLALIYAELY